MLTAWQVARCFDVSIMVMWYYTAYNYWHGHAVDEPASVFYRLGFLWACTASFIGVL